MTFDILRGAPNGFWMYERVEAITHSCSDTETTVVMKTCKVKSYDPFLAYLLLEI